MKRHFFIILLTCLISSVLYSQDKAIYFELGGPGLASFNYDMRFAKTPDGIGGRIGFGGFSVGTGIDRATAVFIPIGVNYLIGKDTRNFFEVGGGLTVVTTNDGGSGNFSSTFGHLSFGYRMQPKDNGFLFRAAINPVFGKGFFIPYYGAIAFGYKF